MAFDIEQIKAAYIKLKSNIYYDNSNILLRRQLVEFESNREKSDLIAQILGSPKPYKGINRGKILPISALVDEKLKQLTDALNRYHEEPAFFDFCLSQIDVQFYPKVFCKDKSDSNFITNRRVEENGYKVDRVNAFIKAPIELHIISVLWIIEHGQRLDEELPDNCLGNRLLLNDKKDDVVQGSGLFKPYFKQYQQWRDESVTVAQNVLGKKKNALFLNLDIRDFFHSVRFPTSEVFKDRKYKSLAEYYNLLEIFLKIHTNYTEKISTKYSVPYDFGNGLKRAKNNDLEEVILPIGLLSSYVLANHYLKGFDNSIISKIKPAYYGRYVDDILIVLEAPNSYDNEDAILEELRFSFADYLNQINNQKVVNESVSFLESDLTNLEVFVLRNFSPVIKLVDSQIQMGRECTDETVNRVFKLTGYKALYCQSEKSLAYFFDHNESDIVIDKLKEELNERTSEFRDFPDHNDDHSFESSAYHLLYDGTEGKIRTLKDYKENRYGLTVFLANKIFSALRHENRITDHEKDQVLKFFRGLNCLNFYRLWEKIFTFFLVNKHADAYVAFYMHCVEQIELLKGNVEGTKVSHELISKTLLDYLDCAHEMALSLNPSFIHRSPDAERNFEFSANKIKAGISGIVGGFQPTDVSSYWVKRFRETNMLRHHYVIHPLLNYTERSRKEAIDLTDLDLDLENYSLSKELLEMSPRPIKFSECCLATAFEDISKFQKTTKKVDDNGYVVSDILNDKTVKEITINSDLEEEEVLRVQFYLDEAYSIYQKGNSNHIAPYLLTTESLKGKFYSIEKSKLEYDDVNPVKVKELTARTSRPNIKEPKISFANTEVDERNIICSIQGAVNLELSRYQKLACILRKARLENSDFLLFPECFIPINLLSSLTGYSEKTDCLVITGLEHLVIKKTAFNFIATILPVEVEGIKDAVVLLRLKNHYSHSEELLITGHHLKVPKPKPYQYDIFNWRNIYFASFYCFELANSLHRSLMKGKIDLMVGIEWNKDTNYFSNIVEAGSRDLHTYVAQVNTSQFGDTRLTQPVETVRKDILRLKGGTNDAILVASIDIEKLRNFQRQNFSLSSIAGDFKPLPPDFSLRDVLKRINNGSIF